MTRTIEISEELYEILEREARPFVETTPQAVLSRLLDEYLAEQGSLQDVATATDSRSKQRQGARRQSRSPGRAKRASRGSLLPEREYELPILRALKETGGSAPSSVVTTAVGEELADRLTEVDKERLRSGGVRWKNRVQFTRLRMIEEGLLEKNSPRGTWEISEKGRQQLASEDA